MKRIAVGVVYLITYPNGKIYIGQDRTNDANYFGSADSRLIAAEFSQRELDDFTIRKQILVRRKNTTIQELNRLEREQIEKHQSNEPKVGYNRWPRGVRRV